MGFKPKQPGSGGHALCPLPVCQASCEGLGTSLPNPLATSHVGQPST